MTKNLKKKNLKDVNKINGFFVHDEPLTIYKSGNSKVVTIPAEFPFEVGDEFMVFQIHDGLMFKTVPKVDSKIPFKLKRLYKIAGTENTPGVKNMTIEEMETELEGVYD